MTRPEAGDPPDPEGSGTPDMAAFRFAGAGRAERIAMDALGSQPVPPDAPGFEWAHLKRDDPGTAGLLKALGLDPLVVDALLAEETRPRCTIHGDGVILVLRGVNLNPDEAPEDMISIRLWIEARRVIGVSARPLHAVADMIDAAERGQGPATPGEFVAKLVLRLTDRAEPAVAELNEEIDDLEDRLLDPMGEISRSALSGVRRRAIMLRRYLVPQKDALTTLEIEDLSWMLERDRSRIREAADRVSRLGEELDAIRERAQVVYDEISEMRAERMNRRMLLLTLVAVIFLPLSLLTGLLGINVAGIPGANDPAAFWIVTGLVAGLGLVLLWWVLRTATFR